MDIRYIIFNSSRRSRQLRRKSTRGKVQQPLVSNLGLSVHMEIYELTERNIFRMQSFQETFLLRNTDKSRRFLTKKMCSTKLGCMFFFTHKKLGLVS